MINQSDNPYAPPTIGGTSERHPPVKRPLRPIWIWLGFSVATSLFGSPGGDPISMLISLIYGLLLFLAGAFLASNLNMVLRVLPLVAGIALTVMLISDPGNVYFAIGFATFGAICAYMGRWASGNLDRGRLRILSCFSIGYVAGSILGPLGTIAGAVAGTLLAKRSYPPATTEL